jgi:hypothetical protein
MPGSNCRWCPKEDSAACHDEGSLYNTCSSSEQITDKDKCPDSPAPSPPPPVPKSSLVEKIMAELFKLLKITDVDAQTCVNDVGGAEVFLRDFAQDIAGKNYSLAMGDLARGLSGLSTSVAGCGLTEVQAKIDLLAASIKWANISTAGFDKDVKIIVDASDLWEDLAGLATAVTSKDSTAIASALNKLLSDWTSITGGCGANSTTCKFLDGLLRMVQVVAANTAPCEAAIEPAVTNLTDAVHLFGQKQYKAAVGDIATALDDLAVALATDACGLKQVASVLSQVAPKLASAVVKVENSTAVKIIVGSAEVYDELYKAAVDVEKGDISDFGVEMGLLLAKLRASGCNSSACIVLDGILASLQLEAQDFAACSKDIDAAWTDMEDSIQQFKSKNYSNGLKALGQTLTTLATGITDCGATDLAKILESVATKLGDPQAATAIGAVVQVLVQGADVTLDMQKLVQDADTKSWSSVGHDLGTLAGWLEGVGCNSFVCKLVEGLLNAAAIPFQNLEACESDLKNAEKDFVAGASSFGQKDFGSGVKYWASGLNYVAKSTSDCGLASELKFMEQEANVLGYGNVSILGEAATVLIHGSDFYEDLYGTFVAFEAHDYRTAGADLGKVMNELSNWTTGHSCTSPVCYVMTGIMQYLGDIQDDIKSCEADLQQSWGNFTAAYGQLHASSAKQLTVAENYLSSSDFGFTTDKNKIKAGIRDIGYGFEDIAKGVSDCHAEELATILSDLAAKLGLAPEVQLLEDILKILIDGVEIENEIGAACVDWSDDNWVGFGYNVIQLIKHLL